MIVAPLKLNVLYRNVKHAKVLLNENVKYEFRVRSVKTWAQIKKLQSELKSWSPDSNRNHSLIYFFLILNLFFQSALPLLNWWGKLETTYVSMQLIKLTVERTSFKTKLSLDNINKQIFHAFLFNIRNYSPEVINIQRREPELNIILPRVNNFDIKQKGV